MTQKKKKKKLKILGGFVKQSLSSGQANTSGLARGTVTWRPFSGCVSGDSDCTFCLRWNRLKLDVREKFQII